MTVFGFVMQISATEWMFQIFAIGLVLVAESLNTAIEKMQDIFTTIAEGPLGMIAGFFADILSNSYAVNAILGAITVTLGRQAIISGITLTKAIGTAVASIWSGSAGLGPVGWALAGGATAALLTAVASAQSSTADDLEMFPSGYGDTVIKKKGIGTIALNNNDSVVAGTNLGGGGGNDKMISLLA